MKTRIIVCAVIEKDGKFLFWRKPENVWPYPNIWHLIWGGVEEWESLQEAILREIQEEANIACKIQTTLSFDEDITQNKHGEDVHYIFLSFLVKYHSGDMRADDDIKELHWFSKQEIKELPLNLPTQRLFQKINFF